MIKKDISIITKLFCIGFFLMLPGHAVAQDFPVTTVQYQAGYQIQGVVVKKSFLKGQKISIGWPNQAKLEGVLFYEGDAAIVNGEYKDETEIINGTFRVWNNKKKRLAVKSKMALEWETVSLSQYSVERPPFRIELIQNGSVNHLCYNLDEPDYGITSIEADVEKNLIDIYGFRSVDSLFLHNRRVIVNYIDGQSFEGSMSFADGFFNPHPIEGVLRGVPAKNIQEISLKKSDENSMTVQFTMNEDAKYKEFSHNLSSSILPDKGDLIFDFLLDHSSDIDANVKMTHDRDYSGSISYSIIGSQLSLKLHDGTITYATGDKFIGNAGGKWIENMPVDGTTYFSDSSVKVGDWISSYKLSATDKDLLSLVYSPTEFIEEAQLMNGRNSKVKTYSGRIIEGPSGYYYTGKPLTAEEGTGKYSYYVENGDKILHGAYSFRFYIYLSSTGKDMISVNGQNYTGDRAGEWVFLHKTGSGATRANLKETYKDGFLSGPYSYTFSADGMKYTMSGQYAEDHFMGAVSITFREGSAGFDISGSFDGNGWADGKWTLIDRRTKKETAYIFNHGDLVSTNGPSRVSVPDIFLDPMEPFAQYKKIINGFKK